MFPSDVSLNSGSSSSSSSNVTISNALPAISQAMAPRLSHQRPFSMSPVPVITLPVGIFKTIAESAMSHQLLTDQPRSAFMTWQALSTADKGDNPALTATLEDYFSRICCGIAADSIRGLIPVSANQSHMEGIGWVCRCLTALQKSTEVPASIAITLPVPPFPLLNAPSSDVFNLPLSSAFSEVADPNFPQPSNDNLHHKAKRQRVGENGRSLSTFLREEQTLYHKSPSGNPGLSCSDTSTDNSSS